MRRLRRPKRPRSMLERLREGRLLWDLQRAKARPRNETSTVELLQLVISLRSVQLHAVFDTFCAVGRYRSHDHKQIMMHCIGVLCLDEGVTFTHRVIQAIPHC